MTKDTLQRKGRPAIDMLEDAIRLLRRAPATALMAYFIGSAPCMLGILYFVSDMSQSAFASSRILQSSMGMALLYLWMKCWQTVFTSRLKAELLTKEPPQWTPARIFRMVMAQAALQPTGLIIRPAALTLTLPSVLAATFYQNVTILGDGEHKNLWDVVRRSGQQCWLWRGQSHLAATLVAIFGLFVWSNICVAMFLVPQLLKMFFGVETVFTKHVGGLFNPTFLAASFAMLYLCINPVLKAFALLRCFHGDSLRTGADLEVQVKHLRLSRPMTMAAMLFLTLFSSLAAPTSAFAGMKEAPKVSAQDLNHSLDDVIERREFAWRTPRDRKVDAKQGAFNNALKNIQHWFMHQLWSFSRWLRHWLERFFNGKEESSSSHFDWWSLLGSAKFLFIALLVLAALLLIVLVLRARRRIPVVEARAEPVASQPDLTREDVTADQLPEDGWLNLANELMQRGELRLALRASYLAGLAHLGHRELIKLARYKSNRDYDRELERRTRSQPELLRAFEGNLNAFERAWYGEHPVTTETLSDFSTNLQTIRAC